MLTHHELCFGCGRTNLFGLRLELSRTGDDSVTGRCFIKQDHHGAEAGTAHDGVIAAALAEAMALAGGMTARLARIEVAITDAAPVGSFIAIEARAAHGSARATATIDDRGLATAIAA